MPQDRLRAALYPIQEAGRLNYTPLHQDGGVRTSLLHFGRHFLGTGDPFN